MSIEESYQCPSCDDAFDSKVGVSGHHVRVHGESIAKEKEKCHNCGSVEEIYPSRRKDSERFFCSKACKSDFYGEKYEDRVRVECEYCGDIYKVPCSRAERGNNFCDQECLAEWCSQRTGKEHPLYDRVEVTCDNCSKVFERAPSNNRYEHVFCSEDCRNEWHSEYISGENHPRWKDDTDRGYGPHWQRQREFVIQRDFERCRICSMTRSEHYEEYGQDLHVHHRTPRRWFDDLEKADELHNLVTLCSKHHMTIEASEFGGDGE